MLGLRRRLSSRRSGTRSFTILGLEPMSCRQSFGTCALSATRANMNKFYSLAAVLLVACSGSNITVSEVASDAGIDSGTDAGFDSWTPVLTPTPPAVVTYEAGLPNCGDSCDDSCRCTWTTTCQSQCGTTVKVCAE